MSPNAEKSALESKKLSARVSATLSRGGRVKANDASFQFTRTQFDSERFAARD